jgi:hypothetical protein
MSTTFVNYCTRNETIFDGLFLFSDIKIPKTILLIDFIIGELMKTRLDYESLGYSFETFANTKNVKYENIEKGWEVIKKHIEHFPIDPPNYSAIENELSAIINDAPEITNMISALTQLYDISKHALESNINALKQDVDKKIGFVGEIFAYVYARDIQKADCLYHKLIPDNPNSFRQGLDLLTIIFKENPEDDEVHFWEAKGTDTNFDGQRNKIVSWFNSDRDSHITMAIDAAKMQWKSEYPVLYRRAAKALARYQGGQNSFQYVGSIVCDLSIIPTNNAIKKFNDIKVDVNNKHFIIFKTEKLLEVVNSVYDKLC